MGEPQLVFHQKLAEDTLTDGRTTPERKPSSSVTDQQGSIVFQLFGRKLKLTTLLRKPMRKVMAQFARHRNIPLASLRFHVKQTGEEVEETGRAAQYVGRLVI